jgi:hypothetical protein
LLTAHENARRAREVISSEMWICLNATRNDLTTQRVRASRVGPASYLHFIRERSALFAGLTDATISHDEAWWYLVLGRSLERIDMTARLLESRLLAEEHSPDWLTLLRAAGAMESYLRVTTGGSDPQAIAAFLHARRGLSSLGLPLTQHGRPLSARVDQCRHRSSAVNQARRTIRTAQTRLEYSEPRRARRTRRAYWRCSSKPARWPTIKSPRTSFATWSPSPGRARRECEPHARPAQFQIRHVTGFNYGGFAESSYNEARMTPQSSSTKKSSSASLRVTPGAVQSTYRDYFDTIVTTFDLHEPHDRLEVVAVATVTDLRRKP